MLNPLSDLHRRRDVEELKRRVLEVESFLREKAPTVARDVEGDMAMGLKGIVAVKQALKSKPKPALRLDDEETRQYEGDSYLHVSSGLEGKVVDVQIVEKVDLRGHLNEENISARTTPVALQRESVYTVIQSLPWTRMPPSNSLPNDSSTIVQSTDGDFRASDIDRLTMQSLSWVPI